MGKLFSVVLPWVLFLYFKSQSTTSVWCRPQSSPQILREFSILILHCPNLSPDGLAVRTLTVLLNCSNVSLKSLIQWNHWFMLANCGSKWTCRSPRYQITIIWPDYTLFESKVLLECSRWSCSMSFLISHVICAYLGESVDIWFFPEISLQINLYNSITFWAPLLPPEFWGTPSNLEQEPMGSLSDWRTVFLSPGLAICFCHEPTRQYDKCVLCPIIDTRTPTHPLIWHPR